MDRWRALPCEIGPPHLDQRVRCKEVGHTVQVIKANLPHGVTIRTHRSGNESLQIAFTYKGKECRETLRHVKPNISGIAEAARRLKIITDAIDDGDFDYSSEFPKSKAARRLDGISSTITVPELMDEYLAKRATILSPSTLCAYRSMIETRIKPAFEDIRVRDLTFSRVVGWLASGDLHGLSLKYIRNLMTPLRRALYFAAHQGYIRDNPIPAQDLDVKLEVPRQHWGSGNKADPLTRTEVAKLLAACSEPPVRNLFQVAFSTGLRGGELIGLRWKDVDLVHKVISIKSTIVRSIVGPTKTTKGTRIVDLLPAAIEALNDQIDHTRHKSRVFCHPVTELPFRTSDQVYDLWKRAVEKAQIRYRAPKQTRHTYASTRISEESGINLFYLADQMGHEGTEMINRHYGKYIKGEKSTIDDGSRREETPTAKTTTSRTARARVENYGRRKR
jgi:integrase